MTEKHPNFTDVFYANAHVRACAKKGLKLQDEGDKKGARAAYKEALKWQKEAERLERAVKQLKNKRARKALSSKRG